MADVKLINTGQDFLLDYRLGDFASDDGFQTAVFVSLFSDRRVASDELPRGETDRKGWWGDVALPGGDQIGSKLWLLERSTLNEATRTLSEEYVRDALQWMIDDGIADTITVTAVLIPRSRIEISTVITRPMEKDKYFYRYQLLWENQRLQLKAA